MKNGDAHSSLDIVIQEIMDTKSRSFEEDVKPIPFDAKGKVLAAKHLVIELPWVVLESQKYRGRYYFYHVETKQSLWSVEKQVIGNYLVGLNKHRRSKNSNTIGMITRSSRSGSIETELEEFLSARDEGESDGRASESSTTSSQTKHRTSMPAPFIKKRSNSFEVMSPSRASIRFSSQENDDDGDDVGNADESHNNQYIVIDGIVSRGMVVKVQEQSSRHAHAMRVIPKQNDKQNALKMEINLLSKINKSCPFLQHCYDCFESVSNVFIISNINEGGDLFTHLTHRMETTGRSFKEIEAKILLAEIYLGLKHLHDHNFIHGDLKLESILVSGAGHIQLSDFGLATHIVADVQPLKLHQPSLIYMAPELLHDKTGGRHTDWWAYGVVAYTLITGHCPWSSFSDREVIISEIGFQEISLKPVHIEYSKATKSFVLSFLRNDYKRRCGTLSEDDIKVSPFFNNYIDWPSMLKLRTLPAFKPANQRGPSMLRRMVSDRSESDEDSQDVLTKYHALVCGLPSSIKEPYSLGLRSSTSVLL